LECARRALRELDRLRQIVAQARQTIRVAALLSRLVAARRCPPAAVRYLKFSRSVRLLRGIRALLPEKGLRLVRGERRGLFPIQQTVCEARGGGGAACPVTRLPIHHRLVCQSIMASESSRRY
jgi:hypothetical protein